MFKRVKFRLWTRRTSVGRAQKGVHACEIHAASGQVVSVAAVQVPTKVFLYSG